MTFGKTKFGLLLACGVMLAGCASQQRLAGTVGGDLPPPDLSAPVYEHRISANDRLSVQVYPATALSMASVRVDATGALLFPPTGLVQAQGKTTRELGAELKTKLAACCLRQPEVIVQIEETTSQQVTIMGAVKESGVYNIQGPTTLMQAITVAKGPDRDTANLKRIAVYRMSNGQRVGAIFNLEDIRGGRAQDPVIYGGDMIIVDTSQSKGAFKAIMNAIPFIGVFSTF